MKFFELALGLEEKDAKDAAASDAHAFQTRNELIHRMLGQAYYNLGTEMGLGI